MRTALVSSLAAVAFVAVHIEAFSTTTTPIRPLVRPTTTTSLPTASSYLSSLSEGDATAAAASSTKQLSPAEIKQQERSELVRQEGGRFAFCTKFGGLNPYGIYYGLTSILLGLPWFAALTLYQFFTFITRGKVDKQRKIPIMISQLWGTTLLTLTRNWPKMEGMEGLQKFYKENRPAMFVANHNSWMDIPFLGATVGWRNYKLVSKAELGKVPILGKAIKVGGNIMVDRSDRRSQLQTLKKGMQYLKDGVHLCTFPEGTRSRSGRLARFKNGAFKMAHKVGAPVIPISIVGAASVMPAHWMFPYRAAHNVAKVIVHPPVESEGKTEQELADAVRDSMITGLPEDQRPKNSSSS